MCIYIYICIYICVCALLFVLVGLFFCLLVCIRMYVCVCRLACLCMSFCGLRVVWWVCAWLFIYSLYRKQCNKLVVRRRLYKYLFTWRANIHAEPGTPADPKQ